MPITITRIIETDNSERKEFIKIQEKRIKQLQTMVEKKNSGEAIHKASRTKVISKLQNAGVLDESGEIAERYRIEE